MRHLALQMRLRGCVALGTGIGCRDDVVAEQLVAVVAVVVVRPATLSLKYLKVPIFEQST